MASRRQWMTYKVLKGKTGNNNGNLAKLPFKNEGEIKFLKMRVTFPDKRAPRGFVASGTTLEETPKKVLQVRSK